MIDLTNESDIKALQANMRTLFNSSMGKEVMIFLEQICGWYDFNELDPNLILIKHGKRQVLATLKTILDLNPDEIVALTRAE